jgi:hypothetical protein
VKLIVCSSTSGSEIGEVLNTVRKVSTDIRKPALDDFKAAKKDNEVPRTFFHNSLVGRTQHLIFFKRKRYLVNKISNNIARREMTVDTSRPC